MKNLLLFTTILFLFFGCSSDDDSGISHNWKASDFYGNWAIATITYNGRTTVPPEPYRDDCGPNYMTLKSNGICVSVEHFNSSCETNVSELNWSYRDGKVSLTDGSTVEIWNIEEVKKDEIILHIKGDFEGNGKIGKAQIVLFRLDDIDIITPNPIDDLNIKIEYKNESVESLNFTWDKYNGKDKFYAYELFAYITNPETHETNEKLVATINDINNTVYRIENKVETSHYAIKVKGKNNEVIVYDEVNLSIANYIRHDLDILSVESFNDRQLKVKIKPINSIFFDYYEISLYRGDNYNPDKTSIFTDQNQTEFIINKIFAPTTKVVVRAKYINGAISQESQDTYQYTQDGIAIVDINLNDNDKLFPLGDGENIFIHNGWNMLRYNIETHTKYPIYSKESTANMLTINPFTYLKDGYIEFYNDEYIYFYNIKTMLLEKSLKVPEARGFYEHIIKINDKYILKDYDEFHIYEERDNQLILVNQVSIDGNIDDDLYRTGPDTFVVKENQNQYREFKINGANLKETRTIYFEPAIGIGSGYMNIEKGIYASIRDNLVYQYPEKSILQSFKNGVDLLGYDVANKISFISEPMNSNNISKIKVLSSTGQELSTLGSFYDPEYIIPIGNRKVMIYGRESNSYNGPYYMIILNY
ncbi:MAG: hypothetical protein ACR2MS_02865 [Weeksellaceae bacterium]